MTLDELKKNKIRLAEDIDNLIIDFVQENGVSIDDITFIDNNNFNNSYPIVFNIRIKI